MVKGRGMWCLEASQIQTVTADGNGLVGPCISSFSKNAKMSYPGKVSGIEVTG